MSDDHRWRAAREVVLVRRGRLPGWFYRGRAPARVIDIRRCNPGGVAARLDEPSVRIEVLVGNVMGRSGVLRRMSSDVGAGRRMYD